MGLALPSPPKEVEERDRERAAARRKRLDTAKAVSAVPSRYRQMTMSTNDDQDGRGKRVPRHHPSANASPHTHTPTDDRGCVIEIHLCGPCPRSSRASRERGEDGAWGARAATAAVTAAHSSRERQRESASSRKSSRQPGLRVEAICGFVTGTPERDRAATESGLARVKAGGGAGKHWLSPLPPASAGGREGEGVPIENRTPIGAYVHSTAASDAEYFFPLPASPSRLAPRRWERERKAPEKRHGSAPTHAHAQQQTTSRRHAPLLLPTTRAPPPNPSHAACSHTQRTLAHAANQLFSLSKKRDHTHPPVPQALHVAPHLWFERCSRNRFPPAHTHTLRSQRASARPPARPHYAFLFFPFPKFFSSQPDHRTGSRDDGHCSSMGPRLCARPPRAFIAVIVVFLPPGGRGKKKSEEESVREGESIWR